MLTSVGFIIHLFHAHEIMSSTKELNGHNSFLFRNFHFQRPEKGMMAQPFFLFG